MNKYIISLGLIVIISAFSSCEDLLDTQQKGVTDISNFYKTDAECEQAISDVYATWLACENNWYTTLNMLADDNWPGGGSRGDNVPRENLGEYAFDAGNAVVTGCFQNMYQIIYRANLVIEYFANGTSTVQKRAVAEAKFFRAWSYFYLVTLWGTPPMVNKVLKTVEEYTQANSNTDEIWALIESDLTDAINSGAMTEKSTADEKVIRITKTAAQSMLGKAYVFQEKWSDARTVLDAVITSGKYELWQGDYEDIIRFEAEFCSENVLEGNILKDPANVRRGIQVYQGWRYSLMTIAAGQGTAHDLAIGWGFYNPTKSIYDAFVAEEGVDGYRLNSVLWTYQQVVDKWNYDVNGVNCAVKVKAGMYLPGHEGYFYWKTRYLNSEKQLVSATGNCHNNVRFMRYAEVLLLGAEAHLQGTGGDLTKAADYINQVRTRAHLPSKPAVTMDDLKTEKRLELCCESVRYQDLVRWGDGPTFLGGKGAKVPAFGGRTATTEDHVEWLWSNSGAGFVAGKHELLPFPVTELSVNSKIVQNPGW